MKLNKEELNGYWLEANEETFEALLKAVGITGAVPDPRYKYYAIYNGGLVAITGKELLLQNEKQAFYHNGEFFTRNKAGEIRGLYVTSVPLEEQAYIDACEIVGNDPGGQKAIDWFLEDQKNWLCDDGGSSPFGSTAGMMSHKAITSTSMTSSEYSARMSIGRRGDDIFNKNRISPVHQGAT